MASVSAETAERAFWAMYNNRKKAVHHLVKSGMRPKKVAKAFGISKKLVKSYVRDVEKIEQHKRELDAARFVELWADLSRRVDGEAGLFNDEGSSRTYAH